MDRYEVEELIGRGGMGEVFSAYDTMLGRQVAIKRLRKTDDETISRFLREAQIQARLDHPAIAPVHELQRDKDGQPYFVMKRLTGTTLDRLLESKTRQRLLRAFVDVCLAVELAHTRGIVHRDLKPSNIMLGDFGDVYILDWGIARVRTEKPQRASTQDLALLDGEGTVAGALLGTPGYMSPEQIHNAPDLDGRADVYALGCILFEILAGEPLHPRGHAGIAAPLEDFDARPSQRVPDRDVPPELDAICVAATCALADRTQTAREVGDAVQRYLDGDRDVVARVNLADLELATARTALATGSRREAMRAASRSLALDPRSRDAAQLVGHLMLEPPSEVPAEVEAELTALDDDTMRAQARSGGVSSLAYLVFFPVMYAAGFRSPWFLVVGPLLVMAVAFIAYRIVKRPAHTLTLCSIVCNALLIAAFARVVSPLFVAPVLATLIAMQFGLHPRGGSVVFLWMVLCGAVLVPLGLELIGVLPSTITILGDAIVLRTTATKLSPVITLTALVLYLTTVVGVAVVLPRVLATERATIQRKMQIQAWQLRQLVPRAGTEPA